jgi:hypothetical protein
VTLDIYQEQHETVPRRQPLEQIADPATRRGRIELFDLLLRHLPPPAIVAGDFLDLAALFPISVTDSGSDAR